MKPQRSLDIDGISTPTDLGGKSWREVLIGAIRLEYRAEIYYPEPGSPLYGRGVCIVPGCWRGGYVPAPLRGLDEEFCHTHKRAWNVAGRPGAEWLATAAEQLQDAPRPCQVPTCKRSAGGGLGLCKAHTSRWQKRRQEKRSKEEWLLSASAVPTGTTECAIESCHFVAMANGDLCDAHRQRALRRKQSDPEYVLWERNRRLNMRRQVDYTVLPPLLRLEVQYAMQYRVDTGGPPIPSSFESQLQKIASAGFASFMEHDAAWYIEAVGPGTASGPLSVQRLVAQILRALHELRDDAAGVDEWTRDVWRLDRLGLNTEVTLKTSVRAITFAGIRLDWLKHSYMRWSKWRLQTGKASPTTANQLAYVIREFSDFLVAQPDPPFRSTDLTRDHLLRFLAKVNSEDISDNYKHQKISAVRHFLDEAPLLGWLELKREAKYFGQEIPRQRKITPRFIDEFVMAQLESETALEKAGSEMLATLFALIMETGLRGKDARFIDFDCLIWGHDEQPYLRWLNNKNNTEFVIPVSDPLAAKLSAHQARVRERFPAQHNLLFPSAFGDRHDRPIAQATLTKQLRAWFGALELKARDGTRTRVTMHQFRHTVATRMINDGVPLTAIQKFLGHSSSEMTLTYAAMHDETLREHALKYHQRVNFKGETVSPEEGELADAAWIKDRMSRAKQALPDGYCGRPLVQACPHPNACHSCDHFLTTSEFLPAHREQLSRIDELIETAQDSGWDRMVEMNKQDQLNLRAIIQGLERLGEDNEDAEAS